MKTTHKQLIKAIPTWLFDSAMMAAPPMLANMALPWQKEVTPGAVVAFLAAYLGLAIVWLVILSVSGYTRWRLYGSWRRGFRPCMCDKPTYCLRHRSSAEEPNRPGVVAARLAGGEGA